MKYLLALTFFVSTLLNAGTINLNVGDSIMIQPNTATTVTCGGGENTNCRLPVKNLKDKFDYCASINGNSVEDCLNQIWPNFKRTNNQCVSEGFNVCLLFCKSSFQTLDCLNICN